MPVESVDSLKLIQLEAEPKACILRTEGFTSECPVYPKLHHEGASKSHIAPRGISAHIAIGVILRELYSSSHTPHGMSYPVSRLSFSVVK
jgi:hypothetical protein